MAQASDVAPRADGRDIPAVRRRWRAAIPLELRTTVWLVIATAVVVLATTAYSPRFFQVQTFVVVAFNMAFIGTLAVGVSIVMKSGAELDLSVAMNAAASALILASLLGRGWAFLPALLVSLLFGLGVGLVNALLVVRLGIHPIVATLATMFLITGTIQLLASFVAVPRDSFLRQHLSGLFLGVPRVFWAMLVLLLVTEAVLALTRPGRHLVAVGGSLSAARARGISPARVQTVAFLACGCIASLAGVVLAAETDVVQTELAVGTEFRVVAVLLLGGIALTGGRGRLVGLLAALLLISTVPTSIVTLGISSDWQPVIEGSILAVALAVDAVRKR